MQGICAESLEARRLLSVSVVGTTLIVRGTMGPDTIEVFAGSVS